jgi:hypothetical protein
MGSAAEAPLVGEPAPAGGCIRGGPCGDSHDLDIRVKV